jgi:hypothetical protein
VAGSAITAVTISFDVVAERLSVPRVQINDRTFTNAAQVQQAWFDGVALVETPFFFFLDSDDALPVGYEEILARCQDAPITYTKESVNGEVSEPGPYSRESHLTNPLKLHHLVVCHTETAKSAIARLPRGHYWPEMLIYWECARQGAKYVPEVGYHWNRGNGLSRKAFTSCAVMRSLLWCKANP